MIDANVVIDVASRLNALLSEPNPDDELESAQAWADAISKASEFLDRHDHSVAFIGEVGVGKSSLLAVAARLLNTNSPPTDRTSLKTQSLLAIGAGRTTVCEVRVRSENQSTGSSNIGLRIEPIEQEELDKLIDLWAEDEWRRRRGQSRALDEAPPTPQEVARALRAMSGYAERVATFREGGLIRRRAVAPLDDVVPNFDSPAALGQHLRERMQLDQRVQTRWDWPDDSYESLQGLKSLAEAINSGTEPTATLPKAMTFMLPGMLGELSTKIGESNEVELELVDTRGLDAGVGLFGRRDLQNFVANDRAMIVLCSPFKSAPGDAIRGFLSSIKEDARWRNALNRIVLVLLDQGDADQVNGANGDRLIGQEIKVSECQKELEDVGIDINVLPPDQILAIDVLLDSREDLLEALSARLRAIRESVQSDLSKAIENAQTFLDRRGHDQSSRLQQAVDEQIRQQLSRTIPESLPLQDPLEGLYAAVRATRYASIVYASCRRKGEYRNLDLYEAIKAEASRALTAWLTPPIDAALSYLNTASSDPELREISDFVNLRIRQFSQGFVEAVSNFGNAVELEVRNALKSDDALWQRCSNEWGRGGGFKPSVLEHMKKWATGQPFSAYSNLTSIIRSVPFWGDVARPVRPPQFGLYVRNLRALRHVEWKPAAVSLLIGANGAGKTTTLLVLRLLKLTYERGLAEAVRLALGGAQNLGYWHRREGEPIMVGVSIGEVQWQIELNIAEGAIDPIAEEKLTDGDQVVFSRDSLGVLRHNGQVMSPEAGRTALRFLVDRGAVDASIRSVANFFKKVDVFQEPDLVALRRGSPAENHQVLELRGVNAISVLRSWHQSQLMKYRFDFVSGGLREAFPEQFDMMDFEQSGNNLTARIYRPGSDQPSWLMHGANGLLQMLILLCDVANTNAGGVVAIDEPENGLHPFALRVFLRRTRQWAAKNHVTVLLATHSTVLLDEFNATPNAVFVMATCDERDERPVPLDQLRDPEWLNGFNLGELYAQGEIGSNNDN